MTEYIDFVDVDAFKNDFTWIVLTRIDPSNNARRYYALAYIETLLGWAVVRSYGRIGHYKRTLAPLPFDSLDNAWPTIRKLIQKRLKNGYTVAVDSTEVEPVIRIVLGGEPSKLVPMQQLALIEEQTNP